MKKQIRSPRDASPHSVIVLMHLGETEQNSTPLQLAAYCSRANQKRDKPSFRGANTTSNYNHTLILWWYTLRLSSYYIPHLHIAALNLGPRLPCRGINVNPEIFPKGKPVLDALPSTTVAAVVVAAALGQRHDIARNAGPRWSTCATGARALPRTPAAWTTPRCRRYKRHPAPPGQGRFRARRPVGEGGRPLDGNEPAVGLHKRCECKNNIRTCGHTGGGGEIVLKISRPHPNQRTLTNTIYSLRRSTTGFHRIRLRAHHQARKILSSTGSPLLVRGSCRRRHRWPSPRWRCWPRRGAGLP